MPDEVVLPHDLGQGEVPDLDLLVPTTGHNHRLSGRWRETHAGHPVRVATICCVPGVLALTQGVPELDGLVTGCRNNLRVTNKLTDVMQQQQEGCF